MTRIETIPKPRKAHEPKKNIIKVNNIDPEKYIGEYIPVPFKPYIKNSKVEDQIKTHPVYCAHFGCNKILNRTEAMGTNKCFNHQGPQPGIMSVLSFPVKFKK